MRKILTLMMVSFMILCLFAINCVAIADAREIIMITEYRQMGWGMQYSIGAVDSNGNLWTASLDDWSDIPAEPGELLLWAETTDLLESSGQISGEELMNLKSLIATVPVQTIQTETFVCDAGVHTSYACRRVRDGQTEVITLGKSGDDLFENTDPSAQTLYRSLISMFPNIESYDGEQFAPAGFQRTGIAEFCGYEKDDLSSLEVLAYINDCETGLSETEADKTVTEILSLWVTGKVNSLSVTGNTVCYHLVNPEGTVIAIFEFCGDLLVRADGMYALE